MTLRRIVRIGILVTGLAAAAVAADLKPIQRAASDAQGHITVNGEPFFPILLYDAPVNQPETLKRLKEYGFNTLAARPDDAEGLLANGFYAAVHAGETVKQLDGVLFGIGLDSPALNLKTDLIKNVKDNLKKVREFVPGRPVMHAIGYWLDEPAGVIANRIPPKAQYEDLVQAIDVAAPYLYPVPHQPVRSIAEAVGRADAAGDGRKPLLPILQLFAWDAKDRYPTPAELKCMVYLAIIHGADGIGYYSYGYVTGKQNTTIAAEQPALWQSVKGINAEVTEIGAFLAGAAPDAAVTLSTGAPDVDMRAARKGDAGLILLSNPGDKPQAAVLKVGPKTAGPLKRLDGGAEIAVQDGKASLALAPFESVGLRW